MVFWFLEFTLKMLAWKWQIPLKHFVCLQGTHSQPFFKQLSAYILFEILDCISPYWLLPYPFWVVSCNCPLVMEVKSCATNVWRCRCFCTWESHNTYSNLILSQSWWKCNVSWTTHWFSRKLIFVLRQIQKLHEIHTLN